ncbi:ferrochelatase [Flavipsychrobacter stenotrophus]|uniref:Ferrochelatase n=1 Tax=Flavipsychrobacter stenotrophus TaxID=2077091 RepID=A0A2S7SZJ5_9BACT|nr:ferrochelatase [Flavipsychrobacter stenotrophus]PQJ12373.1 ferrochelatase [Flavipsychrobacter stenotrophus]
MSEKIKRGIILMNLGSPDSTSTKDVKRYLDEFLMDGRVIDSPYLIRTILVKGIITPFRSSKSAEAYSTIWTKEGSPLVQITYQVQRELQKIIKEPVEVAMRYGNPTMKFAYDSLAQKYPDLEEVVLLPLYPHYAMSSYETAVVHAEDVHKEGKYPFKIAAIAPFYNNPDYISALVESIKPHIKNDGKHLLFSYHSIPERHIKKSDITGNHCLKVEDCCNKPSAAHAVCYRHQCYTTTRLVAEQLGLPAGSYSVSFQSKLGRSAWLTPATTARMEQMPKEGIKDLMVVCPSFVSDCLETLEEVAIREKENFMEAGGETYDFIPCMNTQQSWIETIKKWFLNVDEPVTA